MSSPKKKAEPTDPAEKYLADGGLRACSDVFDAHFGTKDAVDLETEFFNLTHNEKLVLQARAEEHKRRQAERKKRLEARRLEDEKRRDLELRMNPANVARCAKNMQRMFRAKRLRAQFVQLVESMKERPKKKGIVIVVDRYDDPKIRNPSLLPTDGFEVARMMQNHGFAVDVYSTTLSDSKYHPTKANISAALARVVKDDDRQALSWVHICGNGGMATVSGKNPYKLVLEEQMKATPRTRMIRALQASGEKNVNSAMGDVCRFVLPCDARAGRLSFDSIISLDEILDVVDPRHAHQLLGRQTCQRIITVDTVPFGYVEGRKHGGFGLMASTATPQVLFDSPAGDAENPVERFRGLVGWCVIRSLLGEGWISKPMWNCHKREDRIAKQAAQEAEPSQNQQSTLGNSADTDAASASSPLLQVSTAFDPEDENNGTWTLSACSLKELIERNLKRLDITPTVKGEGWFDIPILAGDRAELSLVNIEKMLAATIDPRFGVAAAESGSVKKRKKIPSHVRHRNAEVTYLVDVAPKINVFDSDFVSTLVAWTQVQCQPDPSIPLSRHLKPSIAKPQPIRRLNIGLEANLTELGEAIKAHGSENAMWVAVAAELTGKVLPLKEDAAIGTAPQESPMLGATTSSASPASPSRNAFTNMILQSVVTLPEHFCVYAGKQEEGGITLSFIVRSQEELNGIVNRAKESPILSQKLRTRVKSVFVELSLEVLCPVVAVEQLRAHARRWYDPVGLRLAAVAQSGEAKHLKPSPCCMDPALAESYLVQAVAQMQLKRPDDYVQRVAGGRFVRILSVSSQAHRLNDFDDAGLECLTRRERPQGAATLFTHTGLAICCVLMAGTAEQKAKQSAELAMIASQYETCFGIRFFIWDANDPLKTDPKDPFVKDKLSKLLEAIKQAIPTQTLPALLIFDLFKKRYYRTRLVGNLTYYPAAQVTNFCDEFLRGALGELLPPVRGCRAIGAGISNTKFSLIAL